MAIKERKQITGTEAQIKGYAGHNGVLAYATDTKHLHVLSGTAGTTTKLANMSDIPAPVDISGKADKTYVDTELAEKQTKGDYATNTALTSGLAGKANSSHTHTKSQITDFPTIPDTSTLIPKTGDRGTLVGYDKVTSESSTAVSVNRNTTDTFLTSGAVTTEEITSGRFDECWTKVCALRSTSPTVTLGNGWLWQGGKAPTLAQNDLVIFNKTRGLGTATHIHRA